MMKMLIISTVCALLCFPGAAAFAQPKIHFDTREYRMKTVCVNEQAALLIPFKNIGNEPLVITSAQGSGTPSVSYSRAPVLPNQSGFIEFRWPAQVATKTKQRIVIRTNEGDAYISLWVIVHVI